MDFGMLLGYAGPALALAISGIGSSVGCGIASHAAHGAMENEKTDPGVHGRLVALSAFPASQSVYGIVLMFILIGKTAGKVISVSDGVTIFAVGLLGGLGIMISAVWQGKACATAIKATSKNPSLFGKCAAGPAFIEGFAVFTMVFSIVVAITMVK
jgi:V/A-type H+-transporting ATPase subunit K